MCKTKPKKNQFTLIIVYRQYRLTLFCFKKKRRCATVCVLCDWQYRFGSIVGFAKSFYMLLSLNIYRIWEITWNLINAYENMSICVNQCENCENEKKTFSRIFNQAGCCYSWDYVSLFLHLHFTLLLIASHRITDNYCKWTINDIQNRLIIRWIEKKFIM